MHFNFSATLENPISYHALLMFLICKHLLDVLRSTKHLRGKHTISIKVSCCFVLVRPDRLVKRVCFPTVLSERTPPVSAREDGVTFHGPRKENTNTNKTKPNLNKSVSVRLKQQLYDLRRWWNNLHAPRRTSSYVRSSLNRLYLISTAMPEPKVLSRLATVVNKTSFEAT